MFRRSTHNTYSLLTFSDSSSFVYSVRAICRHNIIHTHKSSSVSDWQQRPTSSAVTPYLLSPCACNRTPLNFHSIKRVMFHGREFFRAELMTRLCNFHEKLPSTPLVEIRKKSLLKCTCYRFCIWSIVDKLHVNKHIAIIIAINIIYKFSYFSYSLLHNMFTILCRNVPVFSHKYMWFYRGMRKSWTRIIILLIN